MGAREYEEDDEAEEAEEEEPEEEEEPDGEDLYEEEEDEDDEEEELPKRKRKHKRSLLVDDAAEEDDEEEAPRKRKSRKTGPQLFIDDAAVVASDDDEEEEDSGEEDFLVHDHTEIPEHESIRRMPSRTLDDMDDPAEMEKIEKSLQERYKRQDMYYDEGEATEVEQQALLPSVKDPKLWMLSCPVGREREAVVCLMQKYLDLQERGEPLLIKSAVAIDHLKGYLYVESERENYVKQAIKGLRSIFSNTVKLVPIKEMTHVLTVDKKSVDIDKENWVRVKLGLYKGDLAKVLDVDHVRQRARIKLVPRIDLAEVAAKMEGRETVKSKRAGYRPSQRFINIQDVKDLKIPIERKRDAGRSEYYDVYAGMMFVDGYHVKTVALKSLNAVDVVPSLDELQSFQKPGEEDGVDASGLSSSRKRGQFMKGDTVVVIEGDLKNLYGVVEKVDEENVEIRPKESGLRDILKFNVRQLSKFFRTGDHVKVISGKHDGATGMIVKVEAEAVVILSDTTKENIRVFKSSIVESSEVTCGLTKLGEFELHDLIALDQTTVGVIVRIESDGCQVLKGTPDKQDVITVKQRDLRRRIFNKNVSTQDRDMNVVNLKDIVRVVDGPFKSKQGPVEHINRGVLFIQDRHHLDNGGFICVRASSCIALGGTRGGNRSDVTSAFSQMRPPSQYLQSPRRSPTRGGGPYGHHNGGGGGGGGGGGYGGGGGRGGGGRQQGNRRNDLLGRTVKIRLGPFKGYRGRVVDANDGNVRIELESQMKVVTVRRDQLSDVGDMPPPVYRENPRYGMGSETPIHPSRTPMHNSAFMTPMRDLTMTPMHDSMRTPMRDRAWNPTATPLRDSGSEDNSWNSRATSPQYQPGTPLANRSYEAPTPGSGWASTPGGNYSDSGSPAESASSYGNPTSPYMPGTPGALPMTPAVPSYLAATPGGQPMTPGNGVLDPTSPAGGYQEADRKWALPDLVVTIRKGNMVGVIKEVGVDGICRVGLGSNGEGEVLNLSQSEMEMVMPRKNDKIKIVHGEWFGKIGKVIGIDGGDGIVRIDDLSHDVKILEMEHIAKAY